MASTDPYLKLCNELKVELQTIKREIALIPSSFTHLLSSKIQQVLGTQQNEIAPKISSTTSRLEKVRSKARSAIENIDRLSLQTSDDLHWKEKLIDILLDVDVTFQDLEDKAETLGVYIQKKEIKVSDLPDKLNLQIIESSQTSKEKILNMLKLLREQGILTTQEYEDKISSL